MKTQEKETQTLQRAKSIAQNMSWMVSEKLLTHEEYKDHINTLAIRLVDREIWVGGLKDYQIIELYLERMTIHNNN